MNARMNIAGDRRDRQIDQRPRHGNADVACRIGVALAGVLHQRDAADGQQNDGAHGDAVVAGHHRMSQFMQHHAAEDDGDQRQAAHRARGAHGHGLREPDKRQQKHEREVDADVHSKQCPGGK